jgi:hypothetical protein
MPERPPVSVIETAEFVTRIARLMNEAERQVLIDHLARNPTLGDVIKGTGAYESSGGASAVAANAVAHA